MAHNARLVLCHRWQSSSVLMDEPRALGRQHAPVRRLGSAMRTKSTLRDVAELAQVSMRTASRVLNGDARVASATRERVQDAMRGLDFRPDPLARSLRAGTDATVGLVVESVADPFFAALTESVEAAMSEQGRSVLVASTHRDASAERRLLDRMLQRRVSGLLIAPTTGDHAWLTDASAAVVFVDRSATGLDADLVDIDDRGAAELAVRHLIEHGHRRIGYIGDLPAVRTSELRLQGYRDALQSAGTALSPELIRVDGLTPRSAGAATVALLELGEPPSAIFSATTRSSLGVVPALHTRHRTDIAMVGFGDFAMADTLRPAITVIDHSAERIGQAAARRLLARIADPTLPVEHIEVGVHLVQRGSGEQRP
jgi:LacI family transcriptional regulator